MIFDCFTFFDELDILELRLSILDEVVDRFVLCEAPFTFRGRPKPLIFAEHRDRFARWNERIVHVVYDAPPDENPWHNEWGQRAFLTSAIAGAAPGDLILIGDVDEIPAPELAARRPEPGRVLAHRQQLAVGYVNRMSPHQWLGTKSIVRRDLGDRTLEDVRGLDRSGGVDVIDGGWHFSALGGPAVMANKMRSYSHAEVDIPYLTDERRLAVFFQNEIDARWVPLDDALPAVLREPRWAPFVWPAPTLDRSEAKVLEHAHGIFGSVPPDAGRIAVLAIREPAAWQRAGAERFGGAFAGAHAGLASAVATLAAGAWLVVDGLAEVALADLAEAATRGINVVAYARNVRGYGAIRPVLDGAPYPAGPPMGRRELESLIAGARFRIERRDDVMDSIFAPQSLEAQEPFDAVAGAFRFTATTHAAMHDFSTHAYVYTLRPSGALAGGSDA